MKYGNLIKPLIRPKLGLIIVTIFLMTLVGILNISIFLAITPIISIIVGSSGYSAISGQESAISLNNIGSLLLQYAHSIFGISENFPLLIFFIVVLLFLVVIKGIFSILGEYFGMKIRMAIEKEMRDTAFLKMCHTDLSFFYRIKIGDVSSIMVQNVLNSASSIQGLLINTPSNFIQVLIFTYLLFTTNFNLGLVVLIVISSTFLTSRYVGNYVKKFNKQALDDLSRLTENIHEFLSTIKVVKAFSAEDFEYSHFKKITEEYSGSSIKHGLAKRVNLPLAELIKYASVCVILLYGTYLVTNGQLSNETFILFLMLLVYESGPLQNFANFIIELKSFTGAFEKFAPLLELDLEVRGGSVVKNSFSDKITFNNVYFRYPNTNIYALDNISFEIKRGKTIGIIGMSGAGKTTLIDIVLGLIQPQDGHISIDGIDRKELDIYSYRHLFSIVTQDPLLFNDTIFNNIVYAADLEKDLEISNKVISVAKTANIHDFIESLPDKYETVVGEKGIMLSGGQKQRVAIARALFTDPEIIIFDEATSALDSESERFIHNSLNQIKGEKTILIIAHRLSTVVSTDIIIVMKQGKIIGVGSHEELLKSNSYYAMIADLQGIK